MSYKNSRLHTYLLTYTSTKCIRQNRVGYCIHETSAWGASGDDTHVHQLILDQTIKHPHI